MEEISYSGAKPGFRRRISKRMVIFGIFFVIVLLLLGSVAYFVTGSSEENEDNTTTITLQDTEEEEAAISEEPTEEPEETEAPTPTNKPTTAPTKAPASGSSSNSSVSVAVQNGSGEAGVAGAAADVLREAGFNVVSTGNAENFEYTGVTIQVKSAKRSALTALEEALEGDYTIGKTSSDLPADTSYDALVIIGS